MKERAVVSKEIGKCEIERGKLESAVFIELGLLIYGYFIELAR